MPSVASCPASASGALRTVVSVWKRRFELVPRGWRYGMCRARGEVVRLIDDLLAGPAGHAQVRGSAPESMHVAVDRPSSARLVRGTRAPPADAVRSHRDRSASRQKQAPHSRSTVNGLLPRTSPPKRPSSGVPTRSERTGESRPSAPVASVCARPAQTTCPVRAKLIGEPVSRKNRPPASATRCPSTTSEDRRNHSPRL